MTGRVSLWRSIRWPALLIGVAILGVLVAFLLDLTPHYEYALTIGAPSLSVVLPIGVVWLVIALISHARRHR